jgi:hypothetical protein
MPCLLRRHEYRVPQKIEKNTIWNGAANRREHDVRQTMVGDELFSRQSLIGMRGWDLVCLSTRERNQFPSVLDRSLRHLSGSLER